MAGRWLALAALWCCRRVGGEDAIVSVVTTREGVTRGATARELPAYEWYNSAVEASERGEYARSVVELEEALKHKPDMPEALINLGNMLSDLAADGAIGSDPARAEALYARAAAAADHPTILAQAESNLGNLLQRYSARDADKLAVAAAHLERAVAADPGFVDARFNYATILADLGRLEEARAAYGAVLDLAPGHENARLNLANTYFAEGANDKAAEIQRRLVNDESLSDGVRLNALNNLGQTFRDGGQHAAAADIFAEAVERFPDDGTSLANLLTARRTVCAWDGYEASQVALLARVRRALAEFDARLRRGAYGAGAPPPLPPEKRRGEPRTRRRTSS